MALNFFLGDGSDFEFTDSDVDPNYQSDKKTYYSDIETSEHFDNISFACTSVNATIAEQQLDHVDVKIVSKVSKSSIIMLFVMQ